MHTVMSSNTEVPFNPQGILKQRVSFSFSRFQLGERTNVLLPCWVQFPGQVCSLNARWISDESTWSGVLLSAARSVSVWLEITLKRTSSSHTLASRSCRNENPRISFLGNESVFGSIAFMTCLLLRRSDVNVRSFCPPVTLWNLTEFSVSSSFMRSLPNQPIVCVREVEVRRSQLMFTSNIRMEEQSYRSQWLRWCRGRWDQTKLAWNGVKNEKKTHPVLQTEISCGQRGTARPVWADRNARVTQITTLYTRDEQKSISQNISNLEVDGLQQLKTTSGSTPVRNLMLQWAETHCAWISFILSKLPRESTPVSSHISHFISYFNWDSFWICMPQISDIQMLLPGEIEVIKKCHLYLVQHRLTHVSSVSSLSTLSPNTASCLISEAVTRATVGEAKHLRKLDPF